MTHTTQKMQRTGREVPARCAVLLSLGWDLPYLCHEVAHGLGGFVLLLPGGVGVGAEGEPCVVVAQNGGDSLDIDAVLEGQGGEGMPEVMESEMLQSGVFQDALVEGSHRVRMVHASGAGGGKEPGVARVLGVFSHLSLIHI